MEKMAQSLWLYLLKITLFKLFNILAFYISL